MQHLIKHLITNNLEEIVSKSYFDCHVKGLHSIMLLSSPEKTIRLFIAVPGSEMWKNYPENVFNGDPMSVAFHPHHCNITLHCIRGKLLNWRVNKVDIGQGMRFRKFIYHSKIREGEILFTPEGENDLQTTMLQDLGYQESTHMMANEIHTVACKERELTAWLVYEGKEDSNYKSFCWTNYDISKVDFSQYYQKMSENDVFNLLKRINLLK